jgi:hypothetical protein
LTNGYDEEQRRMYDVGVLYGDVQSRLYLANIGASIHTK